MIIMKKPVLCVGCAVIDFVTICENFPKEDMDQQCLDGFWQRGGNASNVCTVLRLLDASVEFFGMLSKSAAFNVLTDDLQKRSIAFTHCPHTEKDPPFSSVIITKATGSRTIVHCNKNYPYVLFEDFMKIDLKQYGWVHFEARNADETFKMITAVQEHNKRHTDRIIISLDFEILFEKHLRLCNLCDFVVFSKELATQQGWKSAQMTCFKLRQMLIPNSPTLICPWGNSGAGYLDGLYDYHNSNPYTPESIMDTLGAGDTFMAGFIYATYIMESCLPDAISFANRVASYKICKFGYDHIAHFSKTEYPETKR